MGIEEAVQVAWASTSVSEQVGDQCVEVVPLRGQPLGGAWCRPVEVPASQRRHTRCTTMEDDPVHAQQKN